VKVRDWNKDIPEQPYSGSDTKSPVDYKIRVRDWNKDITIDQLTEEEIRAHT